MKAKVRSLFLIVTIAAGFCLVTEILSVGISKKAYATPNKGENCALCHASKQAKESKESKDTKGFTVDFMPEECGGFSSEGTNPFFILTPGYQLLFQDGAGAELTITVTGETKTVNDVETRVVEERETQDGKLVEVSKNYFAICNRNNSVFYFGEEVDIYNQDGSVSHEGSWLAGENGAKAGIMMPGVILLGAKYFQEIAPGVAMDRAEIKSMTEIVQTPAGTFENCLRTFETTPLERKTKDFKFYARGIGLIKDEDFELVEYGPLP